MGRGSGTTMTSRHESSTLASDHDDDCVKPAKRSLDDLTCLMRDRGYVSSLYQICYGDESDEEESPSESEEVRGCVLTTPDFTFYDCSTITVLLCGLVFQLEIFLDVPVEM